MLAGVSCIAGAACATPTTADDSGPPPTRWEIKPAASVDNGASYWPGAQWRTALPRQVGMDSAALATLSRDVRQRKWPTLRSLLVVHHGYLVFNEYVAGVVPESLQVIQDVTMTATGLLVGIAMREGKLRPDDGVPQFFPEYASLLASGFRNGISVDHLLTMRSGLAFDDEPYEGSDLQALNRSTGDWLRLIFSHPMNAGAGERWRYKSGDVIALGGVLRAATGEPADSYARRTLFSPLGINRSSWLTGQPNGLPHMAGGLSLTSPDMARIGYLLLRKGRWNDAPIVSEEWVASMRERKSRQLGEWLTYSLDYGRMLWLLPPIAGSGDVDVLAASGAFGQWIFVVPGKDLVVVATSEAFTVGPFALPIQLLYDVIIPAAH